MAQFCNRKLIKFVNQKKKKKIVTWPMIWLNRSVATIIVTLQLLDIYRYIDIDNKLFVLYI